MAFNGLFDIPALIMILILFSFYAFRNSIPRMFGLYTVSIIFYMHFTAFINISIQLLTEMTYVISWMDKNQDSTLVKIAQIAFGLEYSKKEDDKKMAKKALHYTIIIAIMTLA